MYLATWPLPWQAFDPRAKFTNFTFMSVTVMLETVLFRIFVCI